MRSLFKSDDWWAVWIGLFVLILGLLAMFGMDVLGWAIKTNTWLDISKAMEPMTKAYAGIPGVVSLFLTYVFMLVIMSVGASALNYNLRKFMISFTFIFWISYGCWLIGNYGYIAVTPDKLKSFGIPWSLGLTGEAGFVVALIAGLIVGNFFPGFAEYLKEGTRPEWYIRTAIVILGASLGVSAAGALGLATAVMFRSLAAIVEAYLIYWALVYFVARRFFKFSREWAAPLAAGISICGVSAAIAVGGAIRARPVVPVMVSSLVVIFAVVELLILPFLAESFLYQQPMVAGAWMGLAVKTDGAAVASGAIADSLIRARALTEQGINYQEGWILMASTTVKTFIDIFIGVWAFILALVWVNVIDKKPGEKVKAVEIWNRFPKFVIGYAIAFLLLLGVSVASPDLLAAAKTATGESNVFRVLFFVMTFFTLGMMSNFKKLWQEGIGRLALVYILCLFGFIVWIGLFISFIFFNGVTPPLA
ncbi:MAG: putative sulfate exporter family transporter [Chloroflexota bacterium]